MHTWPVIAHHPKTRLRSGPAARVIAKCGGINRTAALVGRHRSVVNRWLLPKEKGGTGGLVPARHQRTLLAEAAERGIDLVPEDFFDLPGGREGPPPSPVRPAPFRMAFSRPVG